MKLARSFFYRKVEIGPAYVFHFCIFFLFLVYYFFINIYTKLEIDEIIKSSVMILFFVLGFPAIFILTILSVILSILNLKEWRLAILSIVNLAFIGTFTADFTNDLLIPALALYGILTAIFSYWWYTSRGTK